MSDTDKNKDTDNKVDTPDSTPNSTDKSTPDSTDSKLSDITGNLFTTSNMYMLIWFLVIYIVMYYVLGMFFNKGTEPGEFQQNLGRMLDFIFLISVVVFGISYYTSKPVEQIKADMVVLYDKSVS